jgi:short-subunit dehydrogenase
LEADVERLAEETQRQFGGVNVLCNIAGVHVLRKLHETAALDVEWIFAVNVFGLCHMARHFVPQLQAAAKRGEIAQMINASSGFGVGVPAMGAAAPSAYTGTKHAIVGLSDAMRKELEPDGVSVSVVCPSLVNTQTWNSTSFRQERFGGPVPGTPESKATVEAWGQDPDETASMIIERARRGDFFIMPHNEAAHKTMQVVIDQRYEELAVALRYSSGDD